MKISKEKNRTILSLTEKEYDELRDIVAMYDGCNSAVEEDCREYVKIGRRWCKALGLSSQGFVSKDII